ncbi:hypothetical protein JY97_14575 [Alkalispirochaeta odontotermitis]|uniref:hypothetical protein n=1 Tax=Olavius algarvensis spirochete endosymbiont TaxID=260710 RepID=UPI00052DB606|nr:hypothetical protein [Olavius algarvensis spirochete endosymbiont]KGM38809.1 hypothetical protein JY97_14575 [Alkalispirochaeta odontotermitis]
MPTSILNFFYSIRQSTLGFRMLLSVALIASLYLAIFFVDNEDSLYWPGWYILKLSLGADVERAEETLRSMGVEETISEITADVAYMAIPNLERVSVAKLEEYLVPEDPRRDPYISSVSKLFKSNGSPLIYIRAKHRLSHYKAILERQEEISDWRLMDWRGVRTLLNPLILVVVIALVALFGSTSDRLLARFVSAIPFVVFAFLIKPDTLIPVILVFYLSPNALDIGSRAYTNRILICFGYVPALVSAFLAYDGMHLFLPAVLVSEFVYLILAGTGGQLSVKRMAKKDRFLSRRMALGIRKSLKREHQLFNPVPLSQMYGVFMPGDLHRSVFGAYNMRDLLLTALVILIFLIPEFAPVNHGPIPYTQKSTENFENLKAMELLDMNRNSTNLPDVSLLMASTAYQEGFLFGAVFRLPRLNESLMIRNYSQVGNTIESTQTTVAEYNQTWYRQQLSTQLESGVGKLFASLEGPSPVSVVTKQPMNQKGWGDPLTAILWTIAFIALFILALISHDAYVRDSTRSFPGDERVRAA